MEYSELEGFTRITGFNSFKFSDTNSAEVSQRADVARWKMLICKGILCSAQCCEPQCCLRVQQMSQLQIPHERNAQILTCCLHLGGAGNPSRGCCHQRLCTVIALVGSSCLLTDCSQLTWLKIGCGFKHIELKKTTQYHWEYFCFTCTSPLKTEYLATILKWFFLTDEQTEHSVICCG